MIRYRRISVHDPEYAGEKELRHRVLRRPLELALSEEDLRGEASQVHIVAQDDAGKVVGCLLVLFSDERAKVRQLAVDAAYQGRSVGRTLMQLAEEAVRERHIGTVMLHARVTARGFFERAGYAAVSDVFTEVTIPHVAMEKRLEPCA
ncbi:MAG TPA: GNAT family N-acetyltransferase [Nitrospiraceae bacterium]|nr:GNAT family N-acetyltransferase [Nitrospiraceae bacterium]